MSLSELRRLFGEAISSAEPVDEARARFVARGDRAPTTQLETYREQFWLRHVGCMAEDYPALQAVVGEEAFQELCRRYFEAHPAKSYLLRDLGIDFAKFLAESGAPRLHVDLARVEWAFVEGFDAANAPPLDPNAVAQIREDEWPRALIRLHPSMRLLDLAYPAEELRSRFRREGTVVIPEAAESFLAVYRRELLLYVEVLDRPAHALLARLARGEALGPASEAVAADAPPGLVEERLGAWFQRWTAIGLVCGVDVPKP